MNRSSENFTSAAVISRPFTGGLLWNFTPRRRWNVYTVPSFDTVHRSARSGTIEKSVGCVCSGPCGNRTSWP